MRILSIISLFLLSISIAKAQDANSAADSYNNFVESTSKLAVIFGKTYSFYVDACGGKSPTNKKIIEDWRERHEDLAQKIKIAKYFAYKRLATRVGDAEAEHIAADTDQRILLAGQNTTALLKKQQGGAALNCTLDMKRISNGEFDIERIRPGTAKRVDLFIGQQKLNNASAVN